MKKTLILFLVLFTLGAYAIPEDAVCMRYGDPASELSIANTNNPSFVGGNDSLQNIQTGSAHVADQYTLWYSTINGNSAHGSCTYFGQLAGVVGTFTYVPIASLGVTTSSVVITSTGAPIGQGQNPDSWAFPYMSNSDLAFAVNGNVSNSRYNIYVSGLLIW